MVIAIPKFSIENALTNPQMTVIGYGPYILAKSKGQARRVITQAGGDSVDYLVFELKE